MPGMAANDHQEPSVTESAIVDGLRALGLNGSSAVIVHGSLRSFGWVDGGAEAVCRALTATCGTVLMLAATWERTSLPAPPGLVRPHNAVYNTRTWEEFDQALAAGTAYTPDVPIDRGLSRIAETLRLGFDHVRGSHPLFSFVSTGEHAARLIEAHGWEHPLGPIDELAELNGDVLLLGVDHTSNTTIHLAEHRLGRSRFFRYAKIAQGSWAELPAISGESHRFDEIEPDLRAVTREVRIGRCRARRIEVRDVLGATTKRILDDPKALLCDDETCRCGAALQQRLAHQAANG